MSDAIITVEHLSHVYSTGPLAKKALHDINLIVERGSCVAIIGFNGSGKSTLVQHFNGLLRPTEGTVLVDGVNVGEKGTDLRALRQRVGMLFQFPEAQLFEQTVFADVAFGPRRMKLSRHDIRSRVMAALDAVDLPLHEYGWRSPFDLSGGQRRRIALAGVLAMAPRVLILDEPSVGLDGAGRAEFSGYLQRIRREQGVTIVLISHDMSEVATMADWLFVLHQGELVMQGTPRDVFAQSEILNKWSLAVPQLHVLLTMLRQQGMHIPENVFTLDEAFAFLEHALKKQLPGAKPGS